MKSLQQSPGRKKILQWGLLTLASFAAFRFLKGNKKISCAPPPETVKMLTQDGRLVEIDKNLLAAGGQKITNEELKHWIQEKSVKP